MVVIAPARLERRMGLFSGLSKRWHFRLAFLGERIAAGSREPAILERGLPRLCQTHQRKTSKTNVAALAVNRQSLHPAFRSAGRDAQKQRGAIAVHAPFCD